MTPGARAADQHLETAELHHAVYFEGGKAGRVKLRIAGGETVRDGLAEDGLPFGQFEIAQIVAFAAVMMVIEAANAGG